ncbi:MAG: NAD(P)H-hydrate dehydratase [Chloroflexi bacterium]|nr:NAD(P)H-hydrate dehydratase [Chloroflexota bacterium]
MYVVTVDEMRRIEREADAAGHTYAEMMERAGRAVAEVVCGRAPGGAAVLVLCGPGNNGGDGLVAGRCLHEAGYAVSLYLCRRSQSPDPNLERSQALAIPILRAEDDGEGLPALRERVAHCAVVVDALLGSGAAGPVRGVLGDALRALQEAQAQRAQAEPHTIRRLWPGADFSAPHLQTARGGACSGALSSVPARSLMVAVDVPSGLNCDTGEVDAYTPAADVTVTFACPKRGHFLFPGAERVGELLVADIGIDPALVQGVALQVATAEEVAALLPPRPADAHKGSFGKALIVGGCTHYTGAPGLAARGAYRAGAGLVTLAVADRIFPIVASTVPEATYLVLPDDMGALLPEAWRVLAGRVAGYRALLVGPGLGTEPPTAEFLHLLLGHTDSQRRPVGFAASPAAPEQRTVLPPTVLDADALNLLAGRAEWWRALPEGCVLTPHPGEMARLLGCDIDAVQSRRIEAAREAAQAWGCTVVLKGAYTVVAEPTGRATLIPFANPAMATAGTGDVLAGAIVGLMAQGLAGYPAAVCGAYLHALAGELWRERYGVSGMLASDLLARLPEAAGLVRGQAKPRMTHTAS